MSSISGNIEKSSGDRTTKRIIKVEKGYYADTEDAYEMMKFFKPAVEEKMMKKVVQPIESKYPGATYPEVVYDLSAWKKPAVTESTKQEEKKGAKKHKKKR
jgi:hypothetical protein